MLNIEDCIPESTIAAINSVTPPDRKLGGVFPLEEWEKMFDPHVVNQTHCPRCGEEFHSKHRLCCVACTDKFIDGIVERGNKRRAKCKH